MSNGDYKIGYKRPPVESRFRKGQCPNPKGRPRKKAATFSDAVEGTLAKIVPVTSRDGSVQWLSVMELIVKSFSRKAAKGDLTATKALLTLRAHARGRGEGRGIIFDYVDDPTEKPKEQSKRKKKAA